MKTLKYQSAKGDPSHAIENMFAYKKCYMYKALMIIGDFGANLLTLDATFYRRADRDRKVSTHDISAEQ
jgi:hypothetical protein